MSRWKVPASVDQVETDQCGFGVSVLAQSYSPDDRILVGEVVSVHDDLNPPVAPPWIDPAKWDRAVHG